MGRKTCLHSWLAYTCLAAAAIPGSTGPQPPARRGLAGPSGFIFPPSELEETFWKVCGWLRWLQRRFLCDSKAAVIGSGVRGVTSRLRDPTVRRFSRPFLDRSLRNLLEKFLITSLRNFKETKTGEDVWQGRSRR